MKWPRKSSGEPLCDIQVWEVGKKEKGLGYLESSTLWRKSFQYKLRGDCVDLSTRVNLHQQFGAIFCRKLEPGIKGYLAIRCTLSEKGTFRLGCGFDTVSRITSMLYWEYQKGICQQQDQSDWWEDTLWEGLWNGLWGWLCWGCGSMTVWWGNNLCSILGVCYEILRGSGSLFSGCYQTDMASYASSPCTGQYSDCSNHRCSRFVTLQSTC